MLLYNAGLSYKKAGSFVKVSYEAVREWHQKGKEIFDQSVEVKERKRIAVDEKKMKINSATIMRFETHSKNAINEAEKDISD